MRKYFVIRRSLTAAEGPSTAAPPNGAEGGRMADTLALKEERKSRAELKGRAGGTGRTGELMGSRKAGNQCNKRRGRVTRTGKPLWESSACTFETRRKQSEAGTRR